MRSIRHPQKSLHFLLVIHSLTQNFRGTHGLGLGGLGDTKENVAKPQTPPSYILVWFPFACPPHLRGQLNSKRLNLSVVHNIT